MRRTVSRLTRQVLLGVKFFTKMGIVEAGILATRQVQNQLQLRSRLGMWRPRLPCCTQAMESG
jgi:hypothetical protein